MIEPTRVDLGTYKKAPRLLAGTMEEALAPGGGLAPVLDFVKKDARLRLDIRERRFNVYYRGGSLLCGDGRSWPWKLLFDTKYFARQPVAPPDLPASFSSVADARAWIAAFPELMRGMDRWWLANRRHERDHCQNMARDNSPRVRNSAADYLVLDLEYQWARRRFDMVAAKRRPTAADPSGWQEPELVFVEVKSDLGVCSGDSGLVAHACGYADVVRAGHAADGIKKEYESLIAQKKRLDLFSESVPFRRFSGTPPGLLVVFVDLDTQAPRLRESISEVQLVADSLGSQGGIHFMRLAAPDYAMGLAKLLTAAPPEG